MTMTPLAKKLIIALAVSGALNVLFAGLLVGGAIRRHRLRDAHAAFGPGARAPRGEGGPRLGRHGGPPGERGGRSERPLAAVLAAHREEMLARRRAGADARQAVEQSLEHEPFDPTALEHSLASLRSETATTQELLHKLVLTAARDGDAEARRKLARGFGQLPDPPL